MFEHKREKANPTTHSHLKHEAFARAQEVTHSPELLAKTLQAIYNDEKPNYDYQKDKENSSFKEQFKKLLSALQQWADENKLNQQLQEKITHLDYHLFAIAGEKQPALFFIDIKKNLEHIFHLLNQPQIPLPRKKSHFTELAANLTMCGPGLYRHIEHHKHLLESPISFSYWLATLRTSLIESAADQYIEKWKTDTIQSLQAKRADKSVIQTQLKIINGNSIHVHNAFLREAFAQGWEPLSSVENISEHFVRLTQVTKEVLDNFVTDFIKQYNLAAISEFLTTTFIAELKLQYEQQAGVKESKSDWMEYDTKFIALAEGLHKNLELDFPTLYFDMEDRAGKTYIRFNARHFKALFFKFCYTKDFLIAKTLWKKEEALPKHELYVFRDLTYANLSWIEDKKHKDIVSATDLSLLDKSLYHLLSWLDYGALDRFHLFFDKHVPVIRYFSSPEAFANFMQLIEANNLFSKMTPIFLELLRTNPLRLLDGLTELKETSFPAFFAAINDIFILSISRDPLYAIYRSLPEKALNQEQNSLSTLLTQRIKEVEQSSAEFNKALRNQIRFYRPEVSSSDILFSELTDRSQNALPYEDQFYNAFLKQYFPTCKINSKKKIKDSFIDCSKASEISRMCVFQDLKIDRINRENSIISFVKNGDIGSLHIYYYLKIADLTEITDGQGESLSYWAHQCKQQSILKYFFNLAERQYPPLALEKNINMTAGKNKATLFHWAVRFGQYAVMKQMLLSKPVNINLSDDQSKTPLAIAVENNDIESIQILLAHGAELNPISSHGITPLITATLIGNLPLVRILVAHGANVNHAIKEYYRCEAGSTPLCLAVDKQRLDIVTFLIRQGADVNTAINQQNRPLILAIKKGNFELAKLLIAHGADVNAIIDEKSCPLNIAIEIGNYNLVKLLVEHRANVDGPHELSHPPIYLAARKGYHQIVALLIENGANVDAECNLDSKTNLNAFALAAKLGHVDVMKVLTEYCKNPFPAENLIKANQTAVNQIEMSRCILVASLNALLRTCPKSNTEAKQGTFFAKIFSNKQIHDAAVVLKHAVVQNSSAEILTIIAKEYSVLKSEALQSYYFYAVELTCQPALASLKVKTGLT